MCTMNETKVTTDIIIAVKGSIKNPICKCMSSPSIQVYKGNSRNGSELLITYQRMMLEVTNETPTMDTATRCVNTGPNFLPINPAIKAPTNGDPTAIKQSIYKVL